MPKYSLHTRFSLLTRLRLPLSILSFHLEMKRSNSSPSYLEANSRPYPKGETRDFQPSMQVTTPKLSKQEIRSLPQAESASSHRITFIT